MERLSRETRIASTFVALADTLVDSYDVVDLLQHLVETCGELLDAQAVGLLLAAEGGDLAVVASTSEETRLIELLQLESGAGPCVEAFVTGKAMTVPDIAVDDRWPLFRAAALAQDFRSVHAVPMRLRATVIGTINLFRTRVGELEADYAETAQGLADMATIGILHERALRESDIARQQLQHALNSRVVIEQAKGVIAQLNAIEMDEAFHKLRDYSRSNGVALREVAELVVNRYLTI